tara:strand:- start:1402 stop:2034 length:633 start_codon:yes stop_codon:yes gene_type:complete
LLLPFLFNPAWATPKRDDEDNDDGSTKANGPETARSTESDAEIVAIRAHLLVSSSKSRASSFLLFSEREKRFSDDDDDDCNDFADAQVDFARRKKSALVRDDDDDDALAVRDFELALRVIAFCLLVVILLKGVVIVVVIIPRLSCYSVLFSFVFSIRGFGVKKVDKISRSFGAKAKEKRAALSHTNRDVLLFSTITLSFHSCASTRPENR